MRIIANLEELSPQEDVILTIGVFDGVHLGHQHLIGQLVQRARQRGALSGLLTLDPHPQVVLSPQKAVGYLTPLAEKITLLDGLGLDLLVVMPFTSRLAHTSARDFVRFITDHLRLRELWVGPDFALGYRRGGDVAFLQELGRELGFTVQVVGPVNHGGEIVSSTRIRSLLAKGRVAETAELLGRYPSLRGQVVAGAKRGKRLGFPTANLAINKRQVIPADGVYAVRVHLGGKSYDGVANIGVRPSFDSGERTVEAHLLDFDHDIYGEELELEFIRRLRDERRFACADELAAQIGRDVEETRRILQPDKNTGFEEIEHTADLAMRAYGRDMRELFANAAHGMFALMAESSVEEPAREREVSLEATDYESLLVDWLNELIYLHEVEGETYSQFAIETLSPEKLKAHVTGGLTKSKTKAIKAATFHDLKIEETANGLVATIVFDV